MDIKKSDEILINNLPADVNSVHFRFPPGSLENDWKDETLRHRETLRKIKEIVNNEKIAGVEAKLMIKDMLEELK